MTVSIFLFFHSASESAPFNVKFRIETCTLLYELEVFYFLHGKPYKIKLKLNEKKFHLFCASSGFEPGDRALTDERIYH